MSTLVYKDHNYGGTTTITDASRVNVDVGGTSITAQQLSNNILGDFASIEATTTASKAYAVGDYLVYSGEFYKVTSAIAQGDTIAVGTNVVKTTVGEEVNELGAETKMIVLGSTSSMSAQQALEATWISDIPVNAGPRNVIVPAQYGNLFGLLNRYGQDGVSYGSGILTRYDGIVYKASLNNNVVTLEGLQDAIACVHTQKSTSGITLGAHQGSSVDVTVTPPTGKTLLAHVAAWHTGVVGVFGQIDGYSVSNQIRPYITNTTNSSITIASSGTIHVLSLYA